MLFAIKVVPTLVPFSYTKSATGLASGGKQQDVNVNDLVIPAINSFKYSVHSGTGFASSMVVSTHIPCLAAHFLPYPICYQVVNYDAL